MPMAGIRKGVRIMQLEDNQYVGTEEIEKKRILLAIFEYEGAARGLQSLLPEIATVIVVSME